jgi:hypothetical protein
MDRADAIEALITDLKAANKERAKLMDHGAWTREEMIKANDKIASIQADIKKLKE